LAVGGVSGVNIAKQMIHSVRNSSAKQVDAAKKKASEEDTANVPVTKLHSLRARK